MAFAFIVQLTVNVICVVSEVVFFIVVVCLFFFFFVFLVLSVELCVLHPLDRPTGITV